ncbi:MAG: hypothetical protein ACYDA3_13840 [Gaiellaceae bacterium]
MSALLRLNRSLTAVVLVAAAALADLAWRVRDWVVMTDELQYAKLATHIGETLSPLPTIRGAHVAAYAQLYPVLIAPFYGTMSAPGAFRAAHLVNAVVFASAGMPAFLLARAAGLSARWSVVCAALALAVPWNVLTAFVMTEPAAYPALLWALLAIVRATAVPSRRRDIIALAAIALAVLARTQFLSLAVVFVVAALLVNRRGHLVLWLACAVGVVAAAVGGSRILGNYAVTAKGFPLPWRALEQAGAHLDVVGVGIALLPLLIGGAWLVANAIRRDPFALTALAAVAVLTLETSSYDARFGGGLADVRSRYLFYLAPLLLIATARSLADERIDRRALAGVTAFVALTVLAHDFPRVPGLYVDAPTAVLNGLVHDSGGKWFVALAAVVAALALVVVRWPPRALVIVVVALVTAGMLATSATAWTRLLDGRGPSSRFVSAAPTVVLDWVDRILPPDSHVAIVPYASYGSWGPNALLWWDVEFWNRDVDRAYVIGSTWDYAPFPHAQLRPDPRTGVIAGTEHAPPYVLMSDNDARIGLQARTEPAARNYGLSVYVVARPYRALWWSEGLDADGWTRPGRAAAIVVPGQTVSVTLQRSDGSAAPSVCGSDRVPLPTKATATIPALPLQPTSTGTRVVGLRVAHVAIVPAC